jgi:1-deoxy-D-xylulose-5-phosphate synthase
VGKAAYLGIDSFTSVVREMVTPHTFFENLGVRYIGPVDGHNIESLEAVLKNASGWDGPIVVHVLTEKGRGYEPATKDNLKMHDYKLPPRLNEEEVPQQSFTQAFSNSLIALASADERIVAITAAMAGPTGLLGFQERFPKRFFDVGIAEQHAVTAAAGMAMGGMKPVVAIYSTFFSRAFDQAHLDVGLLNLPVVFVFDRAGITGDDGPSHHGLLDMALCLSIPGMAVFAPSSAEELEAMVPTALSLDGPAAIRFPKTPPRHVAPEEVGDGMSAKLLRSGDDSVCLIGIGKLLGACLEAADELEAAGVDATVWDPRLVCPADPAMLRDALGHGLVVTAEDGVRMGGAGMFLVDAMTTMAREEGLAMPSVRVLGVPREFLAQAHPDAILSSLGLDGPGVALSVRQELARRRFLTDRAADTFGGAVASDD